MMPLAIRSALLTYSLSVVRAVLYPSYITFNWLACLYITTFEEDRQPLYVSFRRLVLTPIHGALFIIFLPVLVIFLPIRCLLVSYRQPFAYSEQHTAFTQKHGDVINELINQGEYKFGIASANLCLMPEVASKMNHLLDVEGRSRSIGDRITVSQFFNDDWSSRELTWRLKVLKNNSSVDKDSCDEDRVDEIDSSPSELTELIGDVTTTFPHLDFLAVQEAWSSYHNKALIKQLHKTFPYVIHDVGVHSFKVNSFVLNSGLLLASKHPIIAVRFKPFNNFVKHAKLLSLGLLMVKVTLGKPREGRRNVGYIFNTHLQSYQGKEPVIPKQLDEIFEWTQEFMEDTTEEGDTVHFVFICGDFNFDNLSPADAESRQHKLFDEYTDVCRIRPGCDKPWTIGTEMRQDHMYDSLVMSPNGLKLAVEDPTLRQIHIIDGDIVEHTKEALAYGQIKMDEQKNVILFPEGGRRRIDYIIYNNAYPVTVKAFHFVTQLASLTDHIPVSMEFSCSNLD